MTDSDPKINRRHEAAESALVSAVDEIEAARGHMADKNWSCAAADIAVAYKNLETASAYIKALQQLRAYSEGRP